jgi:hypothetical protein
MLGAMHDHVRLVKNGPDDSETPLPGTPNNGHHQIGPVGPVRANNGLMHRSKQHRYSITASAVINNAGGNSSPSDVAAF